MFPADKNRLVQSVNRVRVWYGFLLLVVGIFGLRLFYVQVLRYDHYKAAALSDQLKQYEIPANRGIIKAHEAGAEVPIVLNQKLYTLYADPTLVKDPDKAAARLAGAIGGSEKKYARLMSTKKTRYVVLGKRLDARKSEKVLGLKMPGVGTQAQNYRIYPQGSLAAQTLGFVDNDGNGQYGLEQALNDRLAGKPGEVKAVTDADGVPLAASRGNVQTPPTDGDSVITSLDLSMQVQLERILKDQYSRTRSQGLSAVIMDPHTGKIKAMANYPTFDPGNYQNVGDPKLFQNAAVANAIEPGSTMKVLTTAAALDQGVISPDTSFYDPAQWVVDGFKITDIEEDGGAREQNIKSLLNLSLNTGATWELMQMGGGRINQKGIEAWNKYMVKHFFLGRRTGVEQGYEAAGYVPPPDMSAPAISLTYANTSFGQALQMTALQMAAADSAMLNGGTYYRPSLVDEFVSPDGESTKVKPDVIKKGVVSERVSRQMVPLMEHVVRQHYVEGFSYLDFSHNYIVGGKTGTAEVAEPGGKYSKTEFNGTYAGFVGGDKPEYIIVVYNIKPGVAGYAGSNAGQPVFADLAHMLIDNSYVTPKTR
jgi:cell division protein FtsI/penicillin-binding protein 2